MPAKRSMTETETKAAKTLSTKIIEISSARRAVSLPPAALTLLQSRSSSRMARSWLWWASTLPRRATKTNW